MIRHRLTALLLGLAAIGCSGHRPSPAPSSTPLAQAGQSLPASNPFARPSGLQYEAPPFNRIRNQDYQPAIEEGMRQQEAEWEAIARESSGPTFENTIVALDRSGELLTRVNRVFGAVVQANTNDTLQQVQTTEAPKLAAHYDALYLNPEIFRRVQAVYGRRTSLAPEQKALVERYQRNFIRAGAQLSEADKGQLRKLNQEEASLATSFQN